MMGLSGSERILIIRSAVLNRAVVEYSSTKIVLLALFESLKLLEYSNIFEYSNIQILKFQHSFKTRISCNKSILIAYLDFCKLTDSHLVYRSELYNL